MKKGFRTPSFKKSFKAKTTGRLKREAKKAINPLYGKKGMGWVNDPKKAAYNKVYNKTTKSLTGGSGCGCFGCLGTSSMLIGIIILIIVFIV